MHAGISDSCTASAIEREARGYDARASRGDRLMDDADAADLTQQQALAAAMRHRHATLPAIGRCYSCDADIEAGRKFCDRDCLDDYARIESARRRSGSVE